MTLNHSTSIKTVVYCACHTKKEMHSSDTPVLIDLLWINVMHYSSTFYYGPYSSLKYLLTFFGNNYYDYDHY